MENPPILLGDTSFKWVGIIHCNVSFSGIYHLQSHGSCEGLLLKSMVFDWPVLHPMVLLGKPSLELGGLTGDAGSPAGDLASQKDSKGQFFRGFEGYTFQKWW